MATRGGIGVGLEVQKTFIGHPRVLREAAKPTYARTDVCPDSFISTGVDAPFSAACVNRECRSWCKV
jgi:hypothetical protein